MNITKSSTSTWKLDWPSRPGTRLANRYEARTAVGLGQGVSVRAEDLVRPSPAFARHWLGFVASILRPITIVMFALTPLMGVWYGPEHWFPDRHVVELDDGRMLEVLEQRVVESHGHFIFQYLSDVALIDATEVDRGARQILALYAGPKARAESCTTIELIATEWCENGLCWWEDRTFYATRNQDGDWFIFD